MHIFALYKKNLSELVEQDKVNFRVKDAELWNRITKVLRIKPSEKFILFDKKIHCLIQATQEIEKNRLVCGIIEEIQTNRPILPQITFYLPILKKEAFEYSLYVAAATGVTEIVPVITKKSSPIKTSSSRCEKIIIAACEQSKNFFMPKIRDSVRIDEVTKEGISICLDEHGQKISDLILGKESARSKDELSLIMGPEGGLVEEERTLLKNNGFYFCKLTPTILRSREAACIGLGLLRSLV